MVMTTATATINGIGIQYDLSGAGPPILFLNGHGVRAAHWERQRRALEPRYRVITFDDRAAAVDNAAAEPMYPVPQTADDAVALLDHLGIERAHLVGSSTGSLVAQEIALRYSERVRSLTLASAWPHPGPLEHITQPTLVLAAAEATQPPPQVSLELARALPNARFEWMPGGSRFITQHSDRFCAALLAFLDWLGAASA
jgi:pimeloyl-ACP methyl ester carboxylesterase